jgi:hypothetical protein
LPLVVRIARISFSWYLAKDRVSSSGNAAGDRPRNSRALRPLKRKTCQVSSGSGAGVSLAYSLNLVVDHGRPTEWNICRRQID